MPDQFTFDASFIGRSVSGHWKNAFTVFDFEDKDTFKFAGSFIGANQWSIGKFDGGAIHHLSDLRTPIDLNQTYEVSVEFSNNTVTLLHEGDVKVRHEFEEDIRDGRLGLGTINAVAEFDDISIASAAPMPKATDDSVQTLTNTSVVIDVLANDVPVDGTTISLKSVSGGVGNANIENGSVTYTPASDFIGEDTFTYIIEDSDGLTDTGKVSVTVAPGLPFNEDFNDGVADGFKDHSNTWHISEKQYLAASAKDATNLSTVQLGEPLPEEFEMGVQLAMLTERGFWTNALVAFDVESPDNFKYAGVYKGLGVWTIGHYEDGQDRRLAKVNAPSNANTDYAVKLLFDGSDVTLNVDGTDLLDYTFDEPLNDGDLGLATRNAHARYDDVYIKSVDDVLGEWE